MDSRTRGRVWLYEQSLSIMEEELQMKGTRIGSKEEDQEVAEAARAVTEGLADADFVGQVELHTGKNLRDQMTVEKAEEISREGELRGFGNRRN